MKKLPKSAINFINRLKDHDKERKEPVILDVINTKSQEVVNVLCDLFLGENWYVVDPLSTEQVNTLILDNILYKYSHIYRKEAKKYKKERKLNE